jgi:Cyanophycinase and related exopeptidases
MAGSYWRAAGNFSGTTTAARFTALAGGPGGNVVVISTAIGDSQFVSARVARCESRTTEILGVAHVTCLDARDRNEANSAAFLDKLQHADGVWIYGGDEERLGTATSGQKPSLRFSLFSIAAVSSAEPLPER